MGQIADADNVEGRIDGLIRVEIMEALKHLVIGNSPGPSEVYTEMIPSSGDVRIRLLMELCQRILGGK